MRKKVLIVLAGMLLSLASMAFYGRAWVGMLNPALSASLTHQAPIGFLDDDAGGETRDTPIAAYDLSAHQTLSRVILLIRENYVEPDRIKPYDMYLAALDYIQKTVPEIMVDDTAAPARIVVSVGSVSQVFEPGQIHQLWEVTMALRDVFRFLQTRIAEPTQRRDIEYAAINGMLSTLDPHSVLLKPESFDEIKLSTKGEFGGLGIVIAQRDGALTIISPIEGTPAFKVGLKARDRIVKIGEESTVNMALDEAVQRLRGKPGSKVNISVLRKTWTEPRQFTLVRAIIKIESVTSELLPDGIGYVRIKSFQGNTFDDLEAHLEKLKAKNNKAELKGLVLDLRNNPGGLLDQAILVSDRFIERGPLVITVGEGNRKREVKSAHYSGNESSYPMAVLVNGGSASASEIVAGALKNHDRALVIGQQSFGKGSVQVLYDFKDRSALKLTIAQYLTPGDISIQSVGINPDVQILPAMIEKDNVHVFVDDDSLREKDLEKHLEQRGATSVVEATQIKITHLEPKEADSLKPDAEEPQLDAFAYDFETRLAHDVLVQAKGLQRATILKDTLPLFKDRAHEQEAIIAKRFAELGADWSTGVVPGKVDAQHKPQVEVSLKSSAIAEPALAGSVLTLTGSVHNTSDVPLYRVYGVTASDNPFLKNLEFIFGKIMPGETRTWDVKIKLPADMASRADSVTLALSDLHASTKDVRTTAFIRIEEQKKPKFAYSYRLDDKKGNGDGALQVGEEVDLQVDVKNLGLATAEDVTVSLNNLAGKAVFLEQGRNKLGSLAVGETKTATLHFSVRADVADISQINLRLIMWDGTVGVSLAETLHLPVLQPRSTQLAEHHLVVKNQHEAPVYVGANEDLPVLGYVPTGGTLHSDAQWPGWYRIDATVLGKIGYVKQDDVELTKARPNGKVATRLAPLVTAPTIFLELPSLIVNNDVLHIRGYVKDDRHLKDVFVFVNDKKVYYRAYENTPTTELAEQVPFDIAVHLKKGTNAVAVIAREDEDLMSRKMFGVCRQEPSTTALPVPATVP